jgi:cytochrome c-type biogenesis protein CcmH/NrfF
MYEIEHHKKPVNWANIALWITCVAAIIVVGFDLFVWRA